MGSLTTKDSTRDIKKVLAGIMVDYNIKIPSDTILDRVVKFIKMGYPATNPPEFQEAFTMNLLGRNWSMLEAYGSLDNAFIGRVMAKYLEWKRGMNTRIQPKAFLENKEEWTPKDSYDELMKNKTLRGNYSVSIAPYKNCYRYATESGIFKHNPKEYDKELKKSRGKVAKMQNRGDAAVDLLMGVISDKGTAEEILEDNAVRMTCKELFLLLHP